MIPFGTRAAPSMTSAGLPTGDEIEGVAIKGTTHIATSNGLTTELFRDDWAGIDAPVRHVIRVRLDSGAISAFHCHEIQTDSIHTIEGRILAVLHDSRPDSPTNGRTVSFRLHGEGPRTLVIPPGVWHGFKAMNGPATFINMITDPYDYTDPDEWRIPEDGPEIGFDWATAR